MYSIYRSDVPPMRVTKSLILLKEPLNVDNPLSVDTWGDRVDAIELLWAAVRLTSPKSGMMLLFMFAMEYVKIHRNAGRGRSNVRFELN